MLALDAELAAIESRIAALQAENLDLRSRLNPLPREVERLERRQRAAGRPAPGEVELDRTEARVLTYIALHVLQGAPPPDFQHVSAFLEMVSAKTETLLARMQRRKLLYVDDSRPERLYNLTERGKDYLVRTRIFNMRPGSRLKKAGRARRAKSARRRGPDRTH